MDQRERSVTGGRSAGAAKEQPRTRGGWVPVGTAAKRRADHSERGTNHGKQTRGRIVDAARRVFERDGYFDSSIEDIVVEATVSRGSFCTYFESKLDVFQVVANEVDAAINDSLAIPPGEPRLDVVSNLERSHGRYFDAYRENARIYALIEQVAMIDPAIRATRLNGRQRHVERVARSIRRWQAQGLADPTIDAKTSAGALVSMISNFSYWRLVGGDSYDEDRSAATLTDIWVRALGLRGTAAIAPIDDATALDPLEPKRRRRA